MSLFRALNPLSWIGGVGDAVAKVGRVFVGDKAAAEGYAHAESTGARQQFAAEFRQNRTLWDSFIDGLNRLPRPVIALGTIGLFVYCMVAPIGFAERMQALALVPDELWWLLTVVVGFFFGARELSHRRKAQANAANVASVVKDINQIRALDAPRGGPKPVPISASRYHDELKDTAKPLSNAAILEWNRRRAEERGDDAPAG